MVDEKGMAPGIQPVEPKVKIVDMRCRQGNCTCTQAYVYPCDHGARYQCIECKFVWGVSVGGAFNY